MLTMYIYRRSWSIPAHLVLCACVQASSWLKPSPEQCQLYLLHSRLELSLELLVFKKRTGEDQPTMYSWMLSLVNARAFTCPIQPSRVRRGATISVSSCPNTLSSSTNNKHRQRRSQGSLTHRPHCWQRSSDFNVNRQAPASGLAERVVIDAFVQDGRHTYNFSHTFTPTPNPHERFSRTITQAPEPSQNFVTCFDNTCVTLIPRSSNYRGVAQSLLYQAIRGTDYTASGAARITQNLCVLTSRPHLSESE